jgi:hypothetical protein
VTGAASLTSSTDSSRTSESSGLAPAPSAATENLPASPPTLVIVTSPLRVWPGASRSAVSTARPSWSLAMRGPVVAAAMRGASALDSPPVSGGSPVAAHATPNSDIVSVTSDTAKGAMLRRGTAQKSRSLSVS